MKQTSLRGRRRLDYMFQITRFIIRNLLFSVSVTRFRNENPSIDDKTTEVFERLLKARDSGIAGP
jgi:hypothetical protein